MFIRCLALTFLMVTTLGLLSQQVQAADVPTGTIEGRVLNLSNGQYLSNALVAIEGTNLVELTNDFGEYTVRNVPAGPVKLTVTFTGQESKTISVVVEAGKTVSQDVGLSKAKAITEDGTVVLDQYVVASQRYKNAQEIAINEERRSANIKDVVATDALGYIPSGNIGEFVKYIPGVQTEYGASDAFQGANSGGVNASAASQVSVRGFGAAQTQITIDGVPVSGVGPAALTSAIGLDMMSINNASRVEVIKVSTPDMNPSAGGTINLVSKSAFEYAKPTYTISVSGNYNTLDKLSIHKQPGPANEKTYHTMPSMTVSVAVPLTKDFGFSVALSRNYNYSANYKVQAAWQNTATAYTSRTGTSTASSTAALTAANIYTTTGARAPLDTRFPYNTAAWTTATFLTTTTTAGTTVTTRATVYYNVVNMADGRISTLDNPYLRQATDQQNPWSEIKNSASIKLDWKPIKGMTISGSYTGSTYEGVNVDRRLQITIGRPMEWGADYVIGRPYELAIPNVRGVLDTQNNLEQEVTSLDKSGVTHTGYIKLNYIRGPWTLAASASQSMTNMDLDDLKNGHMYKVALSASVGQNIFRGIKDGAPTTFEIYDRNGVAFDYHDLTKWNFNSVDAGSAKSKQTSRAEEYKVDLSRELDFLPFPATVKIGGTHTFDKSTKSGLGTGYKMRYTGDASSLGFVQSITDYNFTRTSGLGFALNQQWGDTYKMYDIYAANPQLFNENFSIDGYSSPNYRSIINNTKSVREISDAYYGMITASFFKNRLQVITGARQSKSKVQGRQAFTDGKWNYVKNLDGTLYRDSVFTQGVKFDGSTNTKADGSTVVNWITSTGADEVALRSRLAAAGLEYPDHILLSQINGTSAATTTNSMEAVKRYLYTKKVDRRRTNPVTPSVITSYNITDDLVFKPSWSREVITPTLDAGNAASSTGGLVGTVNINENNPPLVGTGGDGTISIPNAGLQPKKADAWNFQLAWYNKYGKVGVNYWYKSISNEWVSSTYTRDSAEFAQVMYNNGFDANGTYNNWTITTTDNSFAKSSAYGYEAEFRENLGFFGHIGGYFNVFGNFSHKKSKPSEKEGVAIIQAFNTDTYAGGFNVSAYRASFTVKVVHNNELWDKNNGGSIVTYNGQQIQVYGVTPANYNVKLDFDYQINNTFTFFASADNVTNSKRTTYRRDALGILPSYAQVNTQYEFGRVINLGVRAQF